MCSRIITDGDENNYKSFQRVTKQLLVSDDTTLSFGDGMQRLLPVSNTSLKLTGYLNLNKLINYVSLYFSSFQNFTSKQHTIHHVCWFNDIWSCDGFHICDQLTSFSAIAVQIIQRLFIHPSRLFIHPSYTHYSYWMNTCCHRPILICNLTIFWLFSLMLLYFT